MSLSTALKGDSASWRFRDEKAEETGKWRQPMHEARGCHWNPPERKSTLFLFLFLEDPKLMNMALQRMILNSFREIVGMNDVFWCPKFNDLQVRILLGVLAASRQFFFPATPAERSILCLSNWLETLSKQKVIPLEETQRGHPDIPLATYVCCFFPLKGCVFFNDLDETRQLLQLHWVWNLFFRTERQIQNCLIFFCPIQNW